MTITTKEQLLDALNSNSTTVLIGKLSVAGTLGAVYSSWRMTGNYPAQGAIPANAALCVNGLLGGMTFPAQVSPRKTYLASLAYSNSSAPSSLEIHDRIAHVGGLSGVSTSSQLVGISLSTLVSDPNRVGDPNYSDVQWWIEFYTTTGSTVTTFTLDVVYNDDSTGTIPITIPTLPAVSLMLPITSPIPDKYIKTITSGTLSESTGVQGSFGVTVTRLRTQSSVKKTTTISSASWSDLGFPDVEPTSCLMLVARIGTGTSTGTINGVLKLAHG